MGEKRQKCEICDSKKAFIVWTPLESILLFATAKQKQLTFESVVVCTNCKSRIMLMFKADGNCFEGCQTIEDLIGTVRKELERWKRSKS